MKEVMSLNPDIRYSIHNFSHLFIVHINEKKNEKRSWKQWINQNLAFFLIRKKSEQNTYFIKSVLRSQNKLTSFENRAQEYWR